MKKNPIIVALDVPGRDEALRAIDRLGDAVGYYKIGLQLFTACGPEVVTAVQQAGTGLFLDLKFHDIPNTVKHAVESASRLGVDMLTIHLSGGTEMIQAAIAGNAVPDKCLILGVTVLTSISAATLAETGVEAEPAEQVVRLAKLGSAAGARGFVCSPLEIQALREVLPADAVLVTPGVRPSWAEAGDQKRVMTPKEAVAAGANYLVIGRPILGAADPRAAAERILDEIG